MHYRLNLSFYIREIDHFLSKVEKRQNTADSPK